MKRIWNLALGTAVLCTVLLCGCALSGPTVPDSAAPTDPLTGQELQYPGERTAAVVIDNAASSTTQWGIGSASVVLEALTENGQPTSLCLAYPSVSAMPTVGPVTLGQDLYWRLLSGQEVLPIQRGAGQFARNYLDYYNLRAGGRRWKWAATPFPAMMSGAARRCGIPAAGRSLPCWAA